MKAYSGIKFYEDPRTKTKFDEKILDQVLEQVADSCIQFYSFTVNFHRFFLYGRIDRALNTDGTSVYYRQSEYFSVVASRGLQ